MKIADKHETKRSSLRAQATDSDLQEEMISIQASHPHEQRHSCSIKGFKRCHQFFLQYKEVLSATWTRFRNPCSG